MSITPKIVLKSFTKVYSALKIPPKSSASFCVLYQHIYSIGLKVRKIRTNLPFRVWRWAGAMALARRDKALGSAMALARRSSYFWPDREERATAAPWRALARRYVSTMALVRHRAQ